MKKLYAFIQILLNMLSRANKEIIQLREYLKIADEGIQDSNKLITQWYNAYIKVNEVRDKYWEWLKESREEYWHSEMQRLALINMFHDQLEEKWQEAINDKYFEPWEEDDWLWEADQEYFANEIQRQKDNEYLHWVENELFAPGFYDDCKTCDGWRESEACCICEMFREENNN